MINDVSSVTDKKLNFHFKKTNEAVVAVFIGNQISKKTDAIIKQLKPDRCFMICDININKLYTQEIADAIKNVAPVHIIVHPPDEKNKTLQTLAKISDQFFENGGTTNSVIIALGGGITGNIAGLFSSIVFRGIHLVHIPTTLLAQLDSAVDVKQSVNSPTSKNSLGSYKAPSIIIIDPRFLTSLSDREIRAGLGEAAKHGFSQDEEFVDFLLSCDPRDLHTAEAIITKTINLKIQHWERTPTIWNDKKKLERLTHLGHTVGKILEMIDVDHLTHGEAVSHGMIIEAYMSYLLGNLNVESVNKMYQTLERLQLLYLLSDKYSLKTILEKLYPVGGLEPLYALLKEFGNPDTISTIVPKDIAEEAIAWYITVLAERRKG